ncbi:protein TORNADO 2 [Cryptomeria japonica]|uniref:protein TORNADO 2 n=1 Tax=Cryptomeria japonica TaxID=3369 RepID=UPI0025ABBD52|nr:protein TORNADO 2 [Cryptomeria japonica]XP_057867422.1 protein TORNADO 2 [Cryptomeria japonica]
MATKTKFLTAINFVAMVLSIPVIGTGIWLSTKQDNECVKLLQWVVISLGVVILVVGLLGCMGAFWRVQWMVVLYLLLMFVLIILLLTLVVFVFLVTNRGSGHGHIVPNRAYREYTLGDYSGWLRHRVHAWNRIRNCLASSTTCATLTQRYPLAQDFFNAHLTPIESGCCKPPTLCGYTFVSATYWISPINIGEDMDCLTWNNDQTQLCYSCNSCKAGLLANLKKEWRVADVVLLITLIALIWVYLVGCNAFRRAQTEDIFDQYKQGYT